MTDLRWLIERPIAHRGLHDADAAIVENSASSVAAAAAAGYGIEVDLQLTVDGEAMVHHDDVLGRLVEGSGRLRALESVELRRMRFRTSNDRLMALGDLCDIVAGRVPLVLELKSQFFRTTVNGLIAFSLRLLDKLQ